MRWPWKRRKPGRHWQPPARIPDADRVLHPGGRRSAEILRAIFEEPTQAQPTITPPTAPLMTPAQRWRTRRSSW